MTKLKSCSQTEFKVTFESLKDFFSNRQMAMNLMDNYLDIIKDELPNIQKKYVSNKDSFDTVSFETAYRDIVRLLKCNWDMRQVNLDVEEVFKELRMEFMKKEKNHRDRLAFYFIIIDYALMPKHLNSY